MRRIVAAAPGRATRSRATARTCCPWTTRRRAVVTGLHLSVRPQPRRARHAAAHRSGAPVSRRQDALRQSRRPAATRCRRSLHSCSCCPRASMAGVSRHRRGDLCVVEGHGTTRVADSHAATGARRTSSSCRPGCPCRTKRPKSRSFQHVRPPRAAGAWICGGKRRRLDSEVAVSLSWLKRSAAFCLYSRSSGSHSGIERRRDDLLQLLDRLGIAIELEQRFGEKEVRHGAVRVVGERLAEVFLGLLVAPAKQARHLEVPAAQRAVGGAR